MVHLFKLPSRNGEKVDEQQRQKQGSNSLECLPSLSFGAEKLVEDIHKKACPLLWGIRAKSKMQNSDCVTNVLLKTENQIILRDKCMQSKDLLIYFQCFTVHSVHILTVEEIYNNNNNTEMFIQ